MRYEFPRYQISAVIYGYPRKVFKGRCDEEVVIAGADDGGVGVASGENRVGVSMKFGHDELEVWGTRFKIIDEAQI